MKMWGEICNDITLDGNQPTKSAKEMFEELGWKYEEGKYDHIYKKSEQEDKHTNYTRFLLFSKTTDEYCQLDGSGYERFDVSLIQAITQQMKELGWIE